MTREELLCIEARDNQIYNQGKRYILNKLKAEIEEKEDKLDYTKMSDVALKTAYIEVLKIIDKYKDKEG